MSVRVIAGALGLVAAGGIALAQSPARPGPPARLGPPPGGTVSYRVGADTHSGAS